MSSVMKYPVLLVHGMGFRDNNLIGYWGRIPNALKEAGCDVHLAHGTKTYLRKGERLVYRHAKTGETETVTATKDGYVVAYNANRAHVTYLETMAEELGIIL